MIFMVGRRISLDRPVCWAVAAAAAAGYTIHEMCVVSARVYFGISLPHKTKMKRFG